MDPSAAIEGIIFITSLANWALYVLSVKRPRNWLKDQGTHVETIYDPLYLPTWQSTSWGYGSCYQKQLSFDKFGDCKKKRIEHSQVSE